MTRRLLLSLLLLAVVGCGLPSPNPPAPTPTPTPIAADVAQVIPAATRDYNAGLADLYESLAVATEAGELKSIRDAAQRAVVEDARLRGEYKRSIGDAMAKRLGDEDLPSDAPAFFREMSTAFRKVAK